MTLEQLLKIDVDGVCLLKKSSRGAYFDYGPINYDTEEINTIIRFLKDVGGYDYYLNNVKNEYHKFIEAYKNNNELDDVYAEIRSKLSGGSKENDRMLLLGYCHLYNGLESMIKGYKNRPNSRNNMVISEYTCMSSFQVINNRLMVVSRSTDMSLGFFADIVFIHGYSTCKLNVKHYYWTLNVPHIYGYNFDKTRSIFKKEFNYYLKDFKRPKFKMMTKGIIKDNE